MIVLSNKNINTNVCEFRADMANDLQYLPTTVDYGTGNLETVSPCSSGSVCIVTGTGDVYYLNGDKNEWEIYGSESGSGDSEPPGGWIKDGKAHYWVDIVTENILIPVKAVIDEQVESETTIDWGDGSTDTIILDTSGIDITHTYTNTGTYVITLTAPDNRTAYINRFGGALSSSGGYASDILYCLGCLTFAECPAVQSIPNMNFLGNSRLMTVAIPEGVTSIGKFAFSNCYSLTSITIPKSVTTISTNAFQGCYSLKSMTIPKSVTSIGTSAFSNCQSLNSITISEGVKTIPSLAFNNCYSLNSITIPKSVTSIGSSAFSDCHSLASITIPEGVTSINNHTFSNCSSLKSITIPEDVTSIDTSAFSYCSSLKSIIIPESVTSIGASAFSYCRSLASITIPKSVTSIGGSAFSNCSSLNFIAVLATTPPALSNTTAIPSTITAIYVPADSVDAYKAATNWSTFASKIQAIPT